MPASTTHTTCMSKPQKHDATQSMIFKWGSMHESIQCMYCARAGVRAVCYLPALYSCACNGSLSLCVSVWPGILSMANVCILRLPFPLFFCLYDQVS